MDLQSDDFTLFGLERCFAQDATLLSQRWKSLQREIHPDRFGTQDEHSKRLALQWSARINEAYQRLKNPVSRAAYCCYLAGVDTQAHTNAVLPEDFLLTQMQWRETLQDIDNTTTLDAFATTIAQTQTALLAQLGVAIDHDRDFEAAFVLVQKLRFIEKLLQAIEKKHESFTD